MTRSPGPVALAGTTTRTGCGTDSPVRRGSSVSWRDSDNDGARLQSSRPRPSRQRCQSDVGNGWPADKSLTLIPETFRFALAYGFNPHTGRTTTPWRIRNVIRWVRPNPPVGALGDKFRPATSEMVVFCRTDEAGRKTVLRPGRGAGAIRAEPSPIPRHTRTGETTPNPTNKASSPSVPRADRTAPSRRRAALLRWTGGTSPPTRTRAPTTPPSRPSCV